MIKDGCLRTVEGVDCYAIKDFAPDFYCLINNTIYIKDTHERIIGAISPAQWAREKVFSHDGSGIKFRIQNGMFKFLTPPSGNVKIAFQYRSNCVVWDFESFAEKSEISANTDVPIFDEYLVKLAILWRWLKRSGLDYAEEYEEYDREIRKRFGSELALKDIHLVGHSDLCEQEVKINAATSGK